MRYRRGKISFYTILGIGLLVGGSGFGYTFAPMYWDYYNMKQVVREVALEWRHGGEYKDAIPRMKEQLRIKMGQKNLLDLLDAENQKPLSECKFTSKPKPPAERTIYCEWEVNTAYPLIGTEVDRLFQVEVVVETSGDIAEYAQVINLNTTEPETATNQ